RDLDLCWRRLDLERCAFGPSGRAAGGRTDLYARQAAGEHAVLDDVARLGDVPGEQLPEILLAGRIAEHRVDLLPVLRRPLHQPTALDPVDAWLRELRGLRADLHRRELGLAPQDRQAPGARVPRERDREREAGLELLAVGMVDRQDAVRRQDPAVLVAQ